MIIDVGEQLLQKLGYEVLIARRGKEATETYEKNKDKIDMVILDMIMPDMSGGDTFDRLREINPDIKVLLSSGYSLNGQAIEILDRGCDAFIQKPFNMLQLSRKLREILEK
jgi:two-component system, cell cycle sensor histidine kinase and response regulator CckA